MGEYNRIAQLLKERGLKQTWLAERVGITPSALSQIVSQAVTPTLPVAIRIARELGVAVEYLWPDL